MAPSTARAPIVCVEGPSAVGKTTLAAALAREAGARVVPELDATGAPPVARSAAWFAEREAARWRRAVADAAAAPLVVVDGDPFKGLWYNWVFAADGWPGVDALAPLYAAHVARGTLAFPDLYVVLHASEAALRARRAADATRTRRGFETNLRLVGPQRRYFGALRALAPARVALLDTDDAAALPAAVRAAVAALPAGAPDAPHLLARMAAWVRAHDVDEHEPPRAS
jgi:hypothetical protein